MPSGAAAVKPSLADEEILLCAERQRRGDLQATQTQTHRKDLLLTHAHSFGDDTEDSGRQEPPENPTGHLHLCWSPAPV